MNIKIKHHPGRHCASTALCNIAHYHGLSWSEPTCFGLGAGLGFWFINIPEGSPSRFIHVRSADIEEQFFQRIGCPAAGQKYADAAEGERELCALLNKGLPVLVLTDIYYLPYYRSKTHFPGHAITVWGYHREKQLFYVTDTEREEILEVPFENMRQARFCRGTFFNLEGNLYAPERLAEPAEMSEVIKVAITANSRMLLKDATSFQGMDALAKWGKNIVNWRELPDRQWATRFCYQVIERRGTGGGGFRRMYSEFLREAAYYLPAIASSGLLEMMEEAAAAWSELAGALKAASEQEEPDFSEAVERIARVHKLETAYHHTVLELFEGVRS